MPLYALKFKPRFVEKIWGGRKLQTLLNKPLPPDLAIGESWELFDFPPGVVENSDQWVSAEVSEGPLAGRTLHQLLEQFGPGLLGNLPPIGPHKQFPILIKFLDAREDLSVQVHPPKEYADRHPGAHLKTEAWYVMDAESGSRIYKGVTPGTTRASFEQALAAGAVEQHLAAIPAKVGQCHFLPSGTVHALGAGMLVAEVQTPSDTTFRVYDFNRIDPATGKERKLHVAEALECIDYSGKEPPQPPKSHVGGVFTTVTSLVTCPFFKIEKVRFSEGIEQAIPYNEPVVWMMLEGSAELRVTDQKQPTRVSRGQTVLLPAEMKDPTLKTLADCVWLEITFPARRAG